ncbi:hypothetical protein CsatB_023479 [Cannabis sativa]
MPIKTTPLESPLTSPSQFTLPLSLKPSSFNYFPSFIIPCSWKSRWGSRSSSMILMIHSRLRLLTPIIALEL